jgi:hypothetical protein
MSSDIILENFMHYIIRCIENAISTTWINDFTFYASFPCSVKTFVDKFAKFGKEELIQMDVKYTFKKDDKIMFMSDGGFHVIMTIIHMRRNKYVITLKLGTSYKEAKECF